MAITIAELLEAISTTGLLSPADLQTLQGSLNNNATANSEELVRELVRTGKLTRYQAAAVFQGKSQTLVLGNYLIFDKIGAGGMGQVFRARHRKMDRIVALKVLPKKNLASPDAVERFQREVKAAARLTHGNIVTAHDADEAGGVHFLVMEYVEGVDLSGLVKTQGPLPVAQAVSCILQAARGLQHAHAEGVIHRDIKPSNLLLDKRGRVKILDMGLARFSEPANAASDSRDTATRSELTQTGSVMGTVDYMAPEQAVDTHCADHRADIYSLGCSLYYLLTGGPPYTGETMMKRLVAHREAPIPSLRAARPEVPAELDEAFRLMVAKNVTNRFQSMSDVIGALDKTARPTSATTATAPAAAAGRSRWPLIAGVAAAIVVLLAAVVLFSRGGKEETAQVVTPEAKQFDTLLPAGEKPAANPPVTDAAAPAAETTSNPPSPTKPASEPVVPAAAVPVSDAKPAETKPAETPTQPVAPPTATAPAMPAPATPSVATPGAPLPTVVAAAPMELAASATNPAEADRLPVPEPAAREAAWQVIKQIFADDYAAAKTPDSKADLAKKLIAQADTTNDDPAAKYVLLCEARDLAADAADTTTVDQVAETLAGLYQVDALAMQVEIYQKLAGKSRPAAGNKALAESALALAERAVNADNLDAAEQLLKVASTTASKARAADLLKQAKARGEAIANQKRELEAVKKAEATLAKDANDAAANLTLGKYLCVTQDDWDAGLPHLAKGSDSGLKALAAKSLPAPTDPAALADLGDAWWDAAEAHKGKDGEPLRAGARHWYAAALPALSGIVKAKVEKRLFELDSSAGPVRRPIAGRKGPQENIEFPLAPSVAIKFRLIPAGKFQMGSAESERGRATNEPRHEVTITRPFYMATTETTQAQWQAVMGNNPSHFQSDPLRPVEVVKWTDCQAFIARLNQSPVGRGYQFRLPTEAEWEYACRAGTSTPYSFGGPEGPLAQYAWHKQSSDLTTHPVALLQPNAWGLYDTHGNVWEWVSDWFNESYGGPTGTDPRGPAAGTERTIRGGAYNNSPTNCRSGTRGFKDPNFGADSIGFRLVCEPVGGFKLPRPTAGSSMSSTPIKRAPTRVDLLSQINLQRDVVSGINWLPEGGKLVGTPTSFDGGAASRLVLPFVPPPEYALHMTVTPRTGMSFFVGLATGGAQCGIYLDKGSTGLGMIDGVHPQKNSTTSKSVWDGNKPVDLTIEVRRGGITLKAGDEVIFAWTGEPQQLTLFPTWKVPNPASVFIGTGSSTGTMEISRLDVGPVDAPAKAVVKADSRASAAPAPKPGRGVSGPLAVAPFTTDEAKQYQDRWAAALGMPATLSNSIGMQLIIIPAGEFMMGSGAEDIAAILPRYKDRAPLDAEQPQHKVRITKPYYLGLYEVTQQEYITVTGKNPSAFSATGKAKDQVAGVDTTRHPVEMLSWNEAVEFCDRLSESPGERAAGRSYRLPTEAEWEFACRAGTTTLWNFANDALRDNEFAWWNGAVNAPTHKVGAKKPNSFGLFDMHGNVQEVCLDWFDKGFYAVSPPTDPKGPPAGTDRVSRGGSMTNSPAANRSAARIVSNPDYHYPERGFRVICVTPMMTAAKLVPPADAAKTSR